MPREHGTGTSTWVEALHNYGELELAAGNPELAVELLERALAGAREFPGTGHENLILHGLGDAALEVGDPVRAAARYRAALVAARANGVRRSVPFCLAGLAAAEARSGDRAHAALLWGAAQRADSRYGPMLPNERHRYEEATADLDEQLVETGRNLEEDDALDLALTEPGSPGNAPRPRASSGS